MGGVYRQGKPLKNPQQTEQILREKITNRVPYVALFFTEDEIKILCIHLTKGNYFNSLFEKTGLTINNVDIWASTVLSMLKEVDMIAECNGIYESILCEKYMNSPEYGSLEGYEMVNLENSIIVRGNSSAKIMPEVGEEYAVYGNAWAIPTIMMIKRNGGIAIRRVEKMK
jgi:hypothetical protein